MRSGFSVTGVLPLLALVLLALGGAAPAAQPDRGPTTPRVSDDPPARAPAEVPTPSAPPDGGSREVPARDAARPVDSSFARDVAPLFARWCTACHGSREQHGNLRLDSYGATLAGGDAGPPIVAADPTASLLVAKVERRNRPPMPPRKRLPKSATSAIRSWIAAGAPP